MVFSYFSIYLPKISDLKTYILIFYVYIYTAAVPILYTVVYSQKTDRKKNEFI